MIASGGIRTGGAAENDWSQWRVANTTANIPTPIVGGMLYIRDGDELVAYRIGG